MYIFFYIIIFLYYIIVKLSRLQVFYSFYSIMELLNGNNYGNIVSKLYDFNTIIINLRSIICFTITKITFLIVFTLYVKVYKMYQ